MSTYKFVTREEWLLYRDSKVGDALVDRLLSERDAYREVALQKAEILCQQNPAAEFDVDAEAARIMEGKK